MLVLSSVENRSNRSTTNHWSLGRREGRDWPRENDDEPNVERFAHRSDYDTEKKRKTRLIPSLPGCVFSIDSHDANYWRARATSCWKDAFFSFLCPYTDFITFECFRFADVWPPLSLRKTAELLLSDCHLTEIESYPLQVGWPLFVQRAHCQQKSEREESTTRTVMELTMISLVLVTKNGIGCVGRPVVALSCVRLLTNDEECVMTARRRMNNNELFDTRNASQRLRRTYSWIVVIYDDR